MLYQLKGMVPGEGEVVQEFTLRERETAIGVGRQWHQRGWKPRLMFKSWDGRFFWLTSLLGQRQAIAA